MKKRNYPATKKPRNLDYSTITKLVKKFGLDKLKQVCTESGIYEGAKVLTNLWKKDTDNFVNHTTIRYLRQKYGWVRIVLT